MDMRYRFNPLISTADDATTHPTIMDRVDSICEIKPEPCNCLCEHCPMHVRRLYLEGGLLLRSNRLLNFLPVELHYAFTSSLIVRTIISLLRADKSMRS